jgi:hypothetical protein
MSRNITPQFETGDLVVTRRKAGDIDQGERVAVVRKKMAGIGFQASLTLGGRRGCVVAISTTRWQRS